MTEENSTPDPETSIGSIHIDVLGNQIKYETEMSLPEVVFWLEALKSLIIAQIWEGEPV
mgnify:CR=1 FL=1